MWHGGRGKGVEEGEEGGSEEFPLGKGDEPELGDAQLEVGGGDEAGPEDDHHSAATDFAITDELGAKLDALDEHGYGDELRGSAGGTPDGIELLGGIQFVEVDEVSRECCSYGAAALNGSQ